jgi:autoinducer 2-degrading protein
MFVVLVKVQVRPELLDEFKTAILRNASLSVERDPGCLRFDVLQQQDDSTRWYFYEVYEREQAWIDHRSSAQVDWRQHELGVDGSARAWITCRAAPVLGATAGCGRDDG